MPDSQVQFNTEKFPIKKVFYEGTDKLRAGYALCYNADSDKVSGASDTTSASVNTERVIRVEKPAAGNINYFAGIVSDRDDSKTGPTWITIVQPTTNGISYNIWTDASTTINSTKLYLTIGSYALTASGPVFLAEALQTIDRSDTAGPVQAFLYAPSVIDPASQEVGSSDTFTDAIWRNFPLNDLRQNPNLGTFYEYDPAYNPVATFAPFAEFVATNNTITMVDTTTLAETGQLVMAAETSTGDNDALSVQFAGPVTMSGAKPWALEVELDLTTVTNADMEVLVGLTALATLANAVPFADTGVLADADAVVFATTEAAGDDFGTTYRANGESIVIHDQNAGTATANTAITLGLYYDGTDIQVYVDGTIVADPILASDIADESDLFPEGIVGYLTIGKKADSGITADTDDVNVRAFRVAQLS